MAGGGKIGLRWLVTAVIVMMLGALIGLSISILRSTPPIQPQKVVKSLPPEPVQEPPGYLGAEEQDLEAVHEAQNEALETMYEEGVQAEEWPLESPLTMPEVIEEDSGEDMSNQVKELVERAPAEEGSPPVENELTTKDHPKRVTVGQPQEGPLESKQTIPSEPELEAASETSEIAAVQKKEPSVETTEAPPPSASDSSEKASTQEEPVPFAYTIHLESFRNPQIADRRRNYIEELGLVSFVVKVDLPQKGVFHRVFVGRFPDRAQAESFQVRLKKKFDLPKGRILAASRIGR